ncbi:alanine racemase [Sphingobium scionense]
MTGYIAPLRLRLDGDALLSNWRWLARQGGAPACGAAIKADGYGLGAGRHATAETSGVPRLLRLQLG